MHSNQTSSSLFPLAKAKKSFQTGCFFTCFDFKKKAKKSRRPRKKCLSHGEQNNGSYVPLDSDVPIKLDTIEEKEKVKKKVRFNLNVKTYEPIPKEDDSIHYLSEGEEETKWEFSSNSVATNYRCKSCVNSYDDDDYENNCYDKFGFDEDSDEELDDGLSELSDDGFQHSQENLRDDHEGLKMKSYGRDRSRHGFSVLSPVENLTQWKRLKAKAKAKAETGKVMFQMEGLNLKQEEEGSFLGTRPNSDYLNFKKMGISVI